jgi:potassium-transporting ATPase ATP-binding subunit
LSRERNQAPPGFGALRTRLGRRGERAGIERDPSSAVPPDTPARLRDGTTKLASALAKGDVVVVSAGEIIPGDGVVIEGVAMVEESGITGESAPVIRESGTDRSAVSAGTHVLSNQLVVEIT